MTKPHGNLAITDGVVEINQDSILDFISSCATFARANEEIRCLTGIRRFFPDAATFERFPRILTSLDANIDPRNTREWGDFQTPPALAERVCNLLAAGGWSPSVVIEPSYGEGNFIFAVLRAFPTTKLIYGVELQERYEWQFKVALLVESLLGNRHTAQIDIQRDSIFTHQFPDEILAAEDVLIVGNPPWVTSAELGSLESRNLPAKRNIKSLAGLDALTGKSNFDVAEYVLRRMIELLNGRRGKLAMLCKNSVVKNIVERLPNDGCHVSEVRQVEIDAKREFGVSVEASLLLLTTGRPNRLMTCQVSILNEPERVKRTFGWSRNKFVSSVEGYEETFELDGKSPLVWRQGLKHDCAQIVELDVQGVDVVNGKGERVCLEDEWVYQLLKSSDLRSFAVGLARKKVIVTQRRLNNDTAYLQQSAPKLWNYLCRHEAFFARRRSSIYRNKPRFSMFGIGDYAFKKYKVATSGMYKDPCFSLVSPADDRPVMLDDTCYFLGFDLYQDALFTASLLNCARVRKFLESIVFTDAKRPYTKEILMRVDLIEAASRTSYEELRGIWASASYTPETVIAESDYLEFKERLRGSHAGLQFNS